MILLHNNFKLQDSASKIGTVLFVCRFYLRRRAELFFDDLQMVETQDLRLHDDENLVAWSALPLMVREDGEFY